MISKQMYKVLKEVPHSPATTTFADMEKKKIADINLLKDLLRNALENNYIAFSFRNNPYNDILSSKFSLTESGQIAIEEYTETKYNSRLSTLALIIAGLSFIVSIIALFVP